MCMENTINYLIVRHEGVNVMPSKEITTGLGNNIPETIEKPATPPPVNHYLAAVILFMKKFVLLQ